MVWELLKNVFSKSDMDALDERGNQELGKIYSRVFVLMTTVFILYSFHIDDALPGLPHAAIHIIIGFFSYVVLIQMCQKQIAYKNKNIRFPFIWSIVLFPGEIVYAVHRHLEHLTGMRASESIMIIISVLIGAIMYLIANAFYINSIKDSECDR